PLRGHLRVNGGFRGGPLSVYGGGDRPMRGGGGPPLPRRVDFFLTDRGDADLDAAVERAALFGVVVGARVLLAVADRRDAGARDAARGEVVGDRFGPAPRQVEVVTVRAGRIGMAHDVDQAVGIFLQARRDLVERGAEA